MAHTSSGVDTVVEELSRLDIQSGFPEVLQQELGFLISFMAHLYDCEESENEIHLHNGIVALDVLLKEVGLINELGNIRGIEDWDSNLAYLKADVLDFVKDQIVVLWRKLSVLRTLVDFSAKTCTDHQNLQEFLHFVKDLVDNTSFLSRFFLLKGKEPWPKDWKLSILINLTSFRVGEVVINLVDVLLPKGSVDPLKERTEILEEGLIYIISFFIDPGQEDVANAGDGFFVRIDAVIPEVLLNFYNSITLCIYCISYGNINQLSTNGETESQEDCIWKHQIKLILEELISLKPFLETILELKKERRDLEALWKQIIDTIFLAEHVISSFLIIDDPIWYDMLRLSDVKETIKIIHIEVKKYMDQLHKAEMSSDVTSSSRVSMRQANPASLKNVVVGRGNEVKGMIDSIEEQKMYKPRQLYFDILTDVIGDDAHQSYSARTDDDLAETLRKKLKQQRYLIVLDDIWSIDTWNSLKDSFPDDGQGSRIVFTSRIHDMVSQTKPNCSPYPLCSLSDEESWELLRGKLFHDPTSPLDHWRVHIHHRYWTDPLIERESPNDDETLAGFQERQKRNRNDRQSKRKKTSTKPTSHGGLRFPLYPLFGEIVQYYQIPLARFIPNLISAVLKFTRIRELRKVEPLLLVWRYFFKVCVPSTKDKDWYNVKRNPTSGAKQIVELFDSSPMWKPNYLFVQAPEEFCVTWDHRESREMGVIADVWSKSDKARIEHHRDDITALESFENYLYWTKVMSSSKNTIGLFGDARIFDIKNSDDEESSTQVSRNRKLRRLVKASKAGTKLKKKKKKQQTPAAEKEALIEEVTPVEEDRPVEAIILMRKKKLREEISSLELEKGFLEHEKAINEEAKKKEQLIQAAKEEELARAQAMHIDLKAKLKEYGETHIPKVGLQAWVTAFWNRMLPTGGMANVMNGLLRLSTEQIPLFEPLCDAIPRMGSPSEITAFKGDASTVLPAEPWEEMRVPELDRDFIGIELASDRDSLEEVEEEEKEGQEQEVEEDPVGEEEEHPTGNPVEEASGSLPNVPPNPNTEPYYVHTVHLLILEAEEIKQFPMYAMISSALRKFGNVHNTSIVGAIEKEFADAVQVYNVQVHSHLVRHFKQKEEEWRRRLHQYDLDFQDSLILEANISDEIKKLKDENARLRKREKITVSPWFLEKFNLLALVEKQIEVWTECFIAAIKLLKRRTKEAEFYSKQVAVLQNILVDNEIALPIFDDLDPNEVAKERTTAEEFLLKIDEQDWEIEDLKDKLGHCINQLRAIGFSGVIKPSRVTTPEEKILRFKCIVL
ncbi:OLC1v1012300C1 [Oldenlandia corymbosa var. corymbosa]|uniref:OLC1v1012300C1 n=1 Tax=Oldenlandia corymbosa var. corymbosa TaxID=529605 RepID=A0AAV1DWA5_OLDCO|nr:OLC1v1012300C1 [Oldenlandia corymbosa var. corymbosa]